MLTPRPWRRRDRAKPPCSAPRAGLGLRARDTPRLELASRFVELLAAAAAAGPEIYFGLRSAQLAEAVPRAASSLTPASASCLSGRGCPPTGRRRRLQLAGPSTAAFLALGVSEYPDVHAGPPFACLSCTGCEVLARTRWRRVTGRARDTLTHAGRKDTPSCSSCCTLLSLLCLDSSAAGCWLVSARSIHESHIAMVFLRRPKDKSSSTNGTVSTLSPLQTRPGQEQVPRCSPRALRGRACLGLCTSAQPCLPILLVHDTLTKHYRQPSNPTQAQPCGAESGEGIRRNKKE